MGMRQTLPSSGKGRSMLEAGLMGKPQEWGFLHRTTKLPWEEAAKKLSEL